MLSPCNRVKSVTSDAIFASIRLFCHTIMNTFIHQNGRLTEIIFTTDYNWLGFYLSTANQQKFINISINSTQTHTKTYRQRVRESEKIATSVKNDRSKAMPTPPPLPTTQSIHKPRPSLLPARHKVFILVFYRPPLCPQLWGCTHMNLTNGVGVRLSYAARRG